jgi:hypothetical protein
MVKTALAILTNLLDRSAVLQELYLDLFPGGGRSFRNLSEEELAEKIRSMETLAKEKKVEIIREDQTDDWCQGRVSKEFWRRSREQKKRKEE